jgi:phosphoribosylamine--glycine ligase/phosphoribosylaminoimidazole synthetase
MRMLVLGSGGREHAMAWSLDWASRSCDDVVFVAPGNSGTPNTLSVDPVDPRAVVELCTRENIDLVLIGPEVCLVAGVSDALREANIAVFGPSRAAAQLEASKAFCREFAARHNIPSPRSAHFDGVTAAREAIAWANNQEFDVVVKADGLAAGKGVVVPSSTAERDDAILRLSATGPILLEERLVGDEVSLLVFTDGATVVAMPPAQDHKRIGEADSGPNTGGMGVFAPAQVCPPEMVQQIVDTIVTPTVNGMAAEGTPYVGVLYAGIMLTEDGPKLLEYNCRFGDPEAQTLLPLLVTDLRQIALACINGTLSSLNIEWRADTACTVVLASHGYPDSPRLGDPIRGLDLVKTCDNVEVFHAGTALTNGREVTSGGRVLGVSAIGADLVEARSRAYHAVRHISFDGMQFRRDIGWRELARFTGGYAESGVDIDEGNRAVELMKKKVEATHTEQVLGGVGSFGGVLDVSRLKEFDHPVLVASTDGVGTKVMIAAEMNRYDSIGHDIVNHCVNDVLVQRAVPMFFLDYVASSRISATAVSEIVGGMADACAANNCVLLGGETAEMPGVYSEGHFDVAGTLVGVAEKSRLLPLPTIASGDVLLGIASSGLHTNGYSLARRIFRGMPLDVMPEPMNVSLGEALLAPHRSYLPVLREVLQTDLVKGLVHITGGGMYENIPRILSKELSAIVYKDAWPLPPMFALIQGVSGLPDEELYRTFNMGIGMILVCDPAHENDIRLMINEPVWRIGEITHGNGGVVVQ